MIHVNFMEVSEFLIYMNYVFCPGALLRPLGGYPKLSLVILNTPKYQSTEQIVDGNCIFFS